MSRDKAFDTSPDLRARFLVFMAVVLAGMVVMSALSGCGESVSEYRAREKIEERLKDIERGDAREESSSPVEERLKTLEDRVQRLEDVYRKDNHDR